MISYPRLGVAGRLGNQLLQIAATIGIARTYGAEVSFPAWDYQPYFCVPKELFTSKPGSDAGEIPSNLDPRTRRFLQDLSLWENVANEIRTYFEPSPLAMEILYTDYSQFWKLREQNQEIISIHVRRGDNASRENADWYYPLPTMKYYYSALELLPDVPIVLTSDEPDWCEENFLPKFLDREILLINNSVCRPETVPGQTNPYPAMDWCDLMLQTMADFHVCSNSTYSLCGALFSNDSKAIFPSVWYGKAIDYADHKLMIPDTWLEVEV